MSYIRRHHWARVLTAIEEQHAVTQALRHRAYRDEMTRELELLPKTRASILARWAKAEEQQSRRSKITPIARKVSR